MFSRKEKSSFGSAFLPEFYTAGKQLWFRLFNWTLDESILDVLITEFSSVDDAKSFLTYLHEFIEK